MVLAVPRLATFEHGAKRGQDRTAIFFFFPTPSWFGKRRTLETLEGCRRSRRLQSTYVLDERACPSDQPRCHHPRGQPGRAISNPRKFISRSRRQVGRNVDATLAFPPYSISQRLPLSPSPYPSPPPDRSDAAIVRAPTTVAGPTLTRHLYPCCPACRKIPLSFPLRVSLSLSLSLGFRVCRLRDNYYYYYYWETSRFISFPHQNKNILPVWSECALLLKHTHSFSLYFHLSAAPRLYPQEPTPGTAVVVC